MKRYRDGEDEAPRILDGGNDKTTSPFQSPIGCGTTADLNIVTKKRSQNQSHKHNLGLSVGD